MDRSRENGNAIRHSYAKKKRLHLRNNGSAWLRSLELERKKRRRQTCFKERHASGQSTVEIASTPAAFAGGRATNKEWEREKKCSCTCRRQRNAAHGWIVPFLMKGLCCSSSGFHKKDWSFLFTGTGQEAFRRF